MKTHQNHIHLIGNSEENLYILGKKDKDSYQEMHDQMAKLCARNNIIAKLLKTSTEMARTLLKRDQSQYINELKSYAQGLERPLDDVLFSMLLPEMVSSFNKWAPNLMSIIPGCSSLFSWDEKNQGVIHTRLLDYALSGPFEKNERSILYDFTGEQKVFSYSSTGIALPAVSTMNESGLTLALHYKHGNQFDLEGESIFLIANEVIRNCTNVREAIKLLKKKKSISYWGIYMSDSAGHVASVDISSDNFYQEKFDIRDHEYLYFNNRPILNKKESASFQPFGNTDQCKMRRESLEQTFQKMKDTSKQDLMLRDLKILGAKSKTTKKDSQNWKLTPVTPSSIQLYNFHNSLFKSNFVLGDAPKFYDGNLLKVTNIFGNTKFDQKLNKKEQSRFNQGYQKLARYQTAIDLGNISIAYHNIQMAIELFKGKPEENIAKFFFIVTQYINEKDKRELTYLFDELLLLEKCLPEYLEDHRHLFLLRLGKIIGHKVVDNSKLIKNKNLKQLYKSEMKLKSLAIKSLKYLIFPRVDTLDIIYSY